MEKKGNDQWAGEIANATVRAEESLTRAMACPCGCDAEWVKRYGDEIIIPVLQKLVVDYLKMRSVMSLLAKSLEGGGEKNEGITNGISTGSIN